jgi:hypothetical protein
MEKLILAAVVTNASKIGRTDVLGSSAYFFLQMQLDIL